MSIPTRRAHVHHEVDPPQTNAGQTRVKRGSATHVRLAYSEARERLAAKPLRDAALLFHRQVRGIVRGRRSAGDLVRLWQYLTDWQDSAGHAFMAQSTMARELGCCERHVRSLLRTLRDLGLIRRVDKGGPAGTVRWAFPLLAGALVARPEPGTGEPTRGPLVSGPTAPAPCRISETETATRRASLSGPTQTPPKPHGSAPRPPPRPRVPLPEVDGPDHPLVRRLAEHAPSLSLQQVADELHAALGFERPDGSRAAASHTWSQRALETHLGKRLAWAEANARRAAQWSASKPAIAPHRARAMRGRDAERSAHNDETPATPEQKARTAARLAELARLSGVSPRVEVFEPDDDTNGAAAEMLAIMRGVRAHPPPPS